MSEFVPEIDDESAFGVGSESSHDADVTAAYDAGTKVSQGSIGGADGGVENSHAADIAAAYDDGNASTPIIDGTGLHKPA